MYHHILVPTDGSALSLKAAKTATRLAKELNAKITAVYVIPPYTAPTAADGMILYPGVFSPDRYKAESEKTASKALEKIKAEADTAKVPCETTFVTKVHPW